MGKLFTYVNDKDLFVGFHKRKLTQRLLFKKNANQDYECSFLTKLKQEYGGQFTVKIEGMVMDMAISCANETQFQEYMTENTRSNLGINLRVTILLSGFSPKL